jgi:hypothetical protein
VKDRFLRFYEYSAQEEVQLAPIAPLRMLSWSAQMWMVLRMSFALFLRILLACWLFAGCKERSWWFCCFHSSEPLYSPGSQIYQASADFIQQKNRLERGPEGTPRGVFINMHSCQSQCAEAIFTYPVYCPSFTSTSEFSVWEGKKLELNNWISYLVAQYTHHLDFTPLEKALAEHWCKQPEHYCSFSAKVVYQVYVMEWHVVAGCIRIKVAYTQLDRFREQRVCRSCLVILWRYLDVLA